MDKKLLIGSHISMKSPNYLVDSLRDAVKFGESCFMIYNKSPQVSKFPNFEKLNYLKFKEMLGGTDINPNNVIVHASYLINLANCTKKSTFDFSVESLILELERCEAIGVKTLVLHPGSRLKANLEEGLSRVSEGINLALKRAKSTTRIALETMAGKGSEVGKTFQEINDIINKVDLKDRIGVCWDTCHLNDAGYDIKNNLEGVFKDFDNIVGANKLWCIHFNDSKNPLNAHKDRHENIGYGTIGFNSLLKIAYFKPFSNIPKILETPYIDGKPPYAEEIKMINQKKFNSELKS